MTPFDSLLCIVCGFERGGTTALSELLRQPPDIEAGFEGGFLLATSPAAFPAVEPYYGMALRGWGLALGDMEYVCAAADWPTLYSRLAALVSPGAPVRVFDKTPKYMERLPEVMAKVPGVPAIVVVRDPRALFWSWLKRADERPADWLEQYARRYRSYAAGYAAALEAGFGDRILAVRHEDLSLLPEQEGRRVFAFLGLDFDPAYLYFDPRFRNVRGEGLTSAFALEYREHLSPEACARILEATADWSDWWWEPPEGFALPEVPAERQGPGPVAPRSEEERRLRRRVAGVSRGGPSLFVDRVLASGVRPLDAVLDLGFPPASGAGRLAEAVEPGRFRKVDWEAAALNCGERPGAAAGRFDVITAHSVLPFLDREQTRRLLEHAVGVLGRSGRLFVTAFLDETGEHGSRPMRHGSGRSFPDRPPYHLSTADLLVLARAVGVEVAAVEDIGHPSGQRLVVLRPMLSDERSR